MKSFVYCSYSLVDNDSSDTITSNEQVVPDNYTREHQMLGPMVETFR